MLQVLSIAEAKAIAAAAQARTADERAMVEYLGIGRRTARPPERLPPPFLVVPDAADLAAFDGAEQRRLRRLLAELSPAQRRELIALVWFARSASISVETALRRATRIPPDAQVGYLMSRRLERDIQAGLEKLAASQS